MMTKQDILDGVEEILSRVEDTKRIYNNTRDWNEYDEQLEMTYNTWIYEAEANLIWMINKVLKD